MHILGIPQASSIMAIAAHPDDIESWCAGTLAQAVGQGAMVRLLLVTSGEHGSSDGEKQAHEVAAQREGEARKAAEILGLAEGDLPPLSRWGCGRYPCSSRRSGRVDSPLAAEHPVYS